MTKKNLGTVAGRRFCSGPCGRWRHISDFSPHRWRDGEILYVQSWCRTCRTRYETDRYQHHTPDERLKRQEYERAYRMKTRTNVDPDRLEERIAVESFRPYWELFVRRASVGYHESAHEPFAPRLGLTDLEYATVARAMRENGTQTLDLALVDKVLHHAGAVYLMSQLYIVKRPRRAA